MKKIVLLFLPFFIMSVTGVVSCKSNKGTGDQKKIEIEEVEELTRELEEAVYPLPTSAEVIKMLTELELGYMIGISNPVENLARYSTSSRKAINMGIYGADLSYATLYNMNQDVINYLDVIRVIANDLNMGTIYNEALYDEIKNNFDNKDKLVSVLTRAFNETYIYLSDNEQQSQALMVVAGAWVEGMHITTHISEAVFHVEGIVRVLLEQKRSFELFIELAEPHADDPAVKELLETFEPMKKVYEGIDTSLSLKNVEEIAKTIEIIREKLIS